MNPEQLDISLGPRGAAGISRIIDGKALAAQLRRQVKERVACLEQTHGIRPGLAVILVGENPSSRIYVRNKTTCAAEVGIASRQISLPATIGQQELVAKVASLNEDPGIDGVLVQMPLPRQIDPAAVIEAVDPAKDVDGFHPLNAGRLVSGREGLVPCTALACMLLLKEMVGDLAGLDALLLGRSDIVGKPTALLLLRENCTVTIAQSRTRGLPVLCRRADILIVAIGKPLFVQGEWIKSGAAVVDVGINRIVENGRSRIVGDVDFAAAAPVAAAITPVPGGVGPMTIACLLANTVRAACKRRGIASPEFAALDRST